MHQNIGKLNRNANLLLTPICCTNYNNIRCVN